METQSCRIKRESLIHIQILKWVIQGHLSWPVHFTNAGMVSYTVRHSVTAPFLILLTEILIAPDFHFLMVCLRLPSMLCESQSFSTLITKCMVASVPSRNKRSKISSSQIRVQIIGFWQQQILVAQNFLDCLASSLIKSLSPVGLSFIIWWLEKEWSARWQLLFLFCLAKSFQKYQGGCWQLWLLPYFFLLPPHVPVWQMCLPWTCYIYNSHLFVEYQLSFVHMGFICNNKKCNVKQGLPLWPLHVYSSNAN